MEILKKIKAKIERRIKIHQQNYKEFNDERFLIDECEDKQILSFIESLEKEQDVDLEKEVIRYKVPFSDDREYLNETTLDAIARHFYELGLNAKENAPKIK